MVVVTECCEVMRVIPLSIVAFMALSSPEIAGYPSMLQRKLRT
jgi:hypothetical protein